MPIYITLGSCWRVDSDSRALEWQAPGGAKAAVFSSAGPCPSQLAIPALMETLQCDDALKASEEDTWVTEEPRKLGSFLHFPSCMRSTESRAVLQVFNGMGEGARSFQHSGSWASGYPTFYSNCIHIYTLARPERQQQWSPGDLWIIR